MQLNAGLKRSVVNEPTTLVKLRNYPIEASAKSRSLQHLERSRIVMQKVRGVVLLLQNVP